MTYKTLRLLDALFYTAVGVFAARASALRGWQVFGLLSAGYAIGLYAMEPRLVGLRDLFVAALRGELRAHWRAQRKRTKKGGADR